MNSSEPKAMLAALREAVRRAILTLAALRDPDARFLAVRSGWSIETVRAVEESYGYSKPRVRGFRPTPADISQMEIVAGWLAWLRREQGDYALRRIIGWAMAVPLWRLGERESCSERTIVNRIDRSMNAILKEFGDIDAEVEVIEEQKPATPHAFSTPVQGHVTAGVRKQKGKVYIAGIGIMKDGRVWRNGTERLDERKIA